MSEDPAPYNSTATSCGEKDSSNSLTAPGASDPLVLWIPCKVESTANLREHWTKSSQRKQAEKAAVKKAVAGVRPPKVPDESGAIP